MKAALMVALQMLAAVAASGLEWRVQKDDGGRIYLAEVNYETVTVDHIKELARYPDLVALNLGYGPEGVKLEEGALAQLPATLEALDLCKTNLSEEDLTALSRLNSLEYLVLQTHRQLLVDEDARQSFTGRFAEILGRFPALKVLIIRGDGELDDAGFLRLASLAGLQTLRLDLAPDTQLTNRALEMAANAKALEVLEVSSPQFTDDGVAALVGSRSLKELEISAPRLTSRSFTHLSLIPDLEKLGFSAGELEPRGFRALHQAAHLRELHLQVDDRKGREAVVTDEMMLSLRAHPRLNRFVIRRSQLTGPGLEAMRTLPSFNEALINNRSFDREGFKER